MNIPPVNDQWIKKNRLKMSWGPIGIQKASSAPPKICCYTTHVNQTQNILKICGISPTAKTVLKHLPDTNFTISSLSQGFNGTAVVHPDVKIYRCHQTSVFWLILHGKFCNYMGRGFICIQCILYMYVCLMRHLILLIIVI